MNCTLEVCIIRAVVLGIAFAAFPIPAFAQDHALPDSRLTPGVLNPAVTQANIETAICRPGWSTKVRPPVGYTNRIKRHELATYGYSDRNPRDYELDHRVEIAAGGDPRSPKNLWPQPRHGRWNSLQKDKLEWYVHRAICTHRMTLAQGRAIFLAPDWRVGYVRYIRKNR